MQGVNNRGNWVQSIQELYLLNFNKILKLWTKKERESPFPLCHKKPPHSFSFSQLFTKSHDSLLMSLRMLLLHFTPPPLLKNLQRFCCFPNKCHFLTLPFRPLKDVEQTTSCLWNLRLPLTLGKPFPPNSKLSSQLHLPKSCSVLQMFSCFQSFPDTHLHLTPGM